ncbi:MAG: peptidase [Nocardioidaceae bacterium]|nr:peptidase [Nocardioidaceae bacterium]
MTTRLPLFPLNTVVFPGVVTPLHVFEDRYRALVRDLLTVTDPTERLFGITAIREGYEVGDHGNQSLHRTGTVMQLREVERHEDGRFDIEAVGRQRFLIHDIDAGGEYAVGDVELTEEPDDVGAELEAERTLATFERYRERLSEMRGDLVLVGDLPHDPTYLSWSLAGTCLLTLAERQALLEAPDASTRLALLRRSLINEMQAMRVLPSLPATEVARLRWSPN